MAKFKPYAPPLVRYMLSTPAVDLHDLQREITEMKAMLVDLKAQIEVFTERRKYETWRA